MATNDPMWKTLVEAAADLTDTGEGDFSWSALMKRARSLDPSHYESAFSPVFQSMVIESPTPAVTPLGKVFTRVSRGTYELQSVPDLVRTPTPKLFEESVVRSITQTPLQRDVRHRTLKLDANFDAYVDHFESHVPFTNPRELELHRRTIERRRDLGSVTAALDDETFLDLLFATLIVRGIGARSAKLVPRPQFADALRARLEDLRALEGLSIDDSDLEVSTVAETLHELIETLGIIDSLATVEPGSKALHYLVPNLVPPLDRRWSGRFFGWRQQDPLAHGQRIWIEAFTSLALVASKSEPSRFLDEGWNSSITQVLDNALVGYCQLELKSAIELVEPTPKEAKPAQILRFDLNLRTAPRPAATVAPRRRWFQFWQRNRQVRERA